MRSLAQRRNRQGSIHAARKAIRRLRSILALCRRALEPEVSVIDQKLKHLGDGLSDLRDAHVVATSALQLATGDEREVWIAVASRLEARREALLGAALARDPEFAALRAQLSMLAEAVAGLPWDRLGSMDLVKGLARSARRLAKAERNARQEPHAANSHLWRRRLRRLRMQYQVIRAVRKASPSLLGLPQADPSTSIRTLTRLSDHLGRLQDLRMLRSSLKGMDTSLPLTQMRCRLRSEINRASP
jgi:CHAD domain-containing protein